MTRTTQLIVIGGIYGNEGETEGLLSLVANLEPSSSFPAAGRIIVGSPRSSVVNLGQMNMSPDVAVQLAAYLIALANQAVAACSSATKDPSMYPAYVASRTR